MCTCVTNVSRQAHAHTLRERLALLTKMNGGGGGGIIIPCAALANSSWLVYNLCSVNVIVCVIEFMFIPSTLWAHIGLPPPYPHPLTLGDSIMTHFTTAASNMATQQMIRTFFLVSRADSTPNRIRPITEHNTRTPAAISCNQCLKQQQQQHRITSILIPPPYPLRQRFITVFIHCVYVY